jgi:Sulfotransferase family
MLNLREESVRKIAAAATSSARELMGIGPKYGVVFHHIPKCAGSSVGHALRQAYAPWTRRHIEARASVRAIRVLDLNGEGRGPFDAVNDAWTQIHEFRQRLLFTYLEDGARVVSGHVIYNPRIHDAFAKTHKFITVLRDPVDRFVSQYLHCRRSQSYDHVDASFDADGLVRLGPLWGCAMTSFLGGSSDSPGPWSSIDRMIANAKRAINRLDVVGFVDDLPGFQANLARQLGVRLSLGHSKRSAPEEKETLRLSEVRPLIEQYCAPDIEVYNYARSALAH